MCDQDSFPAASAKTLSRRQFGLAGATAAAGTLAACAPMAGSNKTKSAGLSESAVSIATEDGTMDAFFVYPASGDHPAIIIWPDIASLRNAFRMMARRLAGEGYAVLVANPYYRDVPKDQFADFAAFRSGGGFDKVGPWRDKLSSSAIMRDATSLVRWLDRQDAVDTSSGIGTQGYCMGGSFTVYSASAVPGRIKAAASFHGGGMVRDDEDSPHTLMQSGDAAYLIAIAKNDDAKDPESTATLKQVAAMDGVTAEVEVYAGDHGWTVLDSPAYDKPAAERAWSRMLALYSAAL
ncbi:Carboxymethylenebutenolidase [Alteripontixanthobacter maritimus]|uniref:Carboxymethylenebutenolidase n=1 Tax=Alteripontixanthobacter maritimus TaxID=2161824 RepID=A0A369Q7Q2_9SPHN|nr:dienelactone hydrolase family protein [Alteripontixanthobacter maritimus]RDC60913.1 Carboxymethylenebutenolidase [Alteripontixanthobacter maritimus]